MAMVVAFPCQVPVFAPAYMVPVMAPVAAPVMLAGMAGIPSPPVAAPVPPPAEDAASGSEAGKQTSAQCLPNDAAIAEAAASPELGVSRRKRRLPSRFALIAEDSLRLSHDHEGCHLVQQALEEAEADEIRLAIVAELRGHVWEVVTCPHANHVLQKCVITMKPSDCQFVVDELMEHGAGIASKLARHKYGYRVLQRLLEHMMPQQTAQLVEGLVAECVAVSMHRFGTYVIQSLLEHGTDTQRQQVAAALVPDMARLSGNNDACMVLDAALVRGDAETRDLLAEAILEREDAISAMAHTRRGHVAVLSLLQLAGEELRETAKRHLAKQALELKKCRFGRLVLKSAQVDSAEASN